MASAQQCVLEEMMKEAEAKCKDSLEAQTIISIRNTFHSTLKLYDSMVYFGKVVFPPSIPEGGVAYTGLEKCKAGAVYDGSRPGSPVLKWLLAFNTITNQVYVEAGAKVSDWGEVEKKLDHSGSESSYVDPKYGIKAEAKISNGKIVACFSECY